MTNKDIERLYHKIGLDLRLKDSVVKEIIESQYKFAKETINNLEIPDNVTEEEFDKLKTNFTFKYLIKLYTNYRVVSNYQKRKQNGRNKNNGTSNHRGETSDKEN